MLTGSSLLVRVRELGSIPRSDLVRACGYVATTKDGAERLNYTAFYEALLEAKGFHFGQRSAARSADHSRLGRRLTYTTKVHFNGNLMVGSAYTSLLDLKEGDTFLIQIEAPKGDRQRGEIRLLPRSIASREAAMAGSQSGSETMLAADVGLSATAQPSRSGPAPAKPAAAANPSN